MSSSQSTPDPFGGRFKKPSKGKKASKSNSGTVGGKASEPQSTAAPSTCGANDEIEQFFDDELKSYLSGTGDRILFLKVLAAEGFVSRLH